MNKSKFLYLIILGLIISFCVIVSKYLTNNIDIEHNQKIPSLTNIQIPSQKDTRIVVISDLNSQYGSTEYEPEIDKAIALIAKLKPNLVVGGGDMIAGQKKTLTQEQIEAMWTAFDQHIALPLRQHNIPFGFTIGNHDGSGAIVNNNLVFANERNLAKSYWHQPQHDLAISFLDRANFPFYYSFQQDNIFYLVWDASTHTLDNKQLVWIKNSLNSSFAKQAKMRVVIGHLPLYPVATEKNKPGEYLDSAERLRSLLENYQVHTYISGHDHAYYPGKKGELELLNAGALGQGARQLIGSDAPPRNTMTIVDIDLLSGTTFYTTYDIKTLEIIEYQQLPESITGNNGTIYRKDL